MNTYGWNLLGQTVLAMLALGLCGGWLLGPFRRADRPFLWLASPLTGLFAFGGALAVLYFGCRLPFRWCMWIGFGANVAATVLMLVRGRPRLPSKAQCSAAVVVVLGAAYWASYSSNKSAIDAREPTIAVQDGSDTYGYAIVGDWLRQHPAAERPRPTAVFEVLVHATLYIEASRPVTFLMAAAAADVRGTRALFSYDWLCGVVLGCAVVGCAGLFASNTFSLAALAVGAAMSSWLTVSRTGYLGKTIAYPGGMLLAGLCLGAFTEFTWRRVVVVAWLGFAVALAVNPMFPPVALTLVAGGYLGAVTVLFALARWRDRTASFRDGFVRPLLTTVLVFLVSAVPTFAAHWFMCGRGGVPSTPPNWAVVIPAALDLELPTVALVKPETQVWLVAGCATVLTGLLLTALWRREAAAAALLATALVVPAAWLLGLHQLHLFHGLLYPFTLAGAALLVPPFTAGVSRRSVIVSAALMLVLIGLRVPQSRGARERYVRSKPFNRVIITQSESDAIHAIVGTDSVDVWMAQWPDNCYVVSDLAMRGVDVRLRSPAWERSLKNWAAWGQCPQPDLLGPKCRFTLVERDTYAPVETVRYVGRRYKLCEDAHALTVLSVPEGQVAFDAQWRPILWLGNAPSVMCLNNGTGAPAATRFVTIGAPGPGRPDLTRRTIRYRLDDQAGRVELGPTNWRVNVPLTLAPGLNRLELSVLEPAEPPPSPGAPELLLHLTDPHVEPVGGATER